MIRSTLQHHESARLHVTGSAAYVDDLPELPGTQHVHVIPSPIAAGSVALQKPDLDDLRDVAAILTAEDIPGRNQVGAVATDEPLLVEGRVHCIGQAVALVIGDSLRACRWAAKQVRLNTSEAAPVLTLESGIQEGQFLTEPHSIARGDVHSALAAAEHRWAGTLKTGGQDHFYLETQAALAVPQDDGTMKIYSSTQHPSGVQSKVAAVLGVAKHRIDVVCPRMGGGFGGKETQGAQPACYAALAAWRTGRPAKVRLTRDEDMTQTGKRHPFLSRYEVGFRSDGKIAALTVETFSDGGWSADLSEAVMDRCLFHLDNAYYIPALHFVGRVVRTNNPSNTAFRGFGGPQGVAVIEHILNEASDRFSLDPAEIRRRNYYGAAPEDVTPYGQQVPECRSPRIHAELLATADYASRLAAVAEANASSVHRRRGIGFSPIKFGISFTHGLLNQAGALVHLYTDGSVQLNHGGTEMGQGLHTKLLAVLCAELGLPASSVRVMPTATDKVPNTSATAASSGSDLNGFAVKAACDTLKARLVPVALRLLEGSPEDAGALVFDDARVRLGSVSIDFAELVQTAYRDQVSLSATGYYRTPGIKYDRQAGEGHPFHYYAYGAAITEVEVNGLTGEYHLQRVDILHDVGNSLASVIDVGQVEGGFIQGWGWLSTEELSWGPGGALLTHSPDTYKIPSFGTAPLAFNVRLLEDAAQTGVIHGSKAVGEPPFMLALSGVGALRQAIRAFVPGASWRVPLTLPATPEAVLRAIAELR